MGGLGARRREETEAARQASPGGGRRNGGSGGDGGVCDETQMKKIAGQQHRPRSQIAHTNQRRVVFEAGGLVATVETRGCQGGMGRRGLFGCVWRS